MSAPNRIAQQEHAQLSCIQPGAGESFFLSGELVTTKLNGAASGGGCVLSEITVLPQGGPPLHRHMQFETLIMLEGQVEATGVRHGAFVKQTLHPGSILHIPGCVPHSYLNTAAAPARMLCFSGPAGMDTFLAEAGEPVAADQLATCSGKTTSQEQFLEAALDFGVEPIDPELFDRREGYRSTGVHFFATESARPMAMPSTLVRFLARNEHTESHLSLLDMEQLPGGVTPLISHQQAVVFYILGGEARFVVLQRDGRHTIEASAGAAVLIPRSAYYSYASSTDAALHMLGFFTPAGIEDFILAASQPCDTAEFRRRSGSSPSAEDVERLADAGILHGVTIIPLESGTD